MTQQMIPVPEKLRVFASSTITECATERKVAKDAIESLNHDAILFEHYGARPESARSFYTRKLDESHVFVGIYRESYGWIAPEAAISGIEDEYHRARQRGMPILAYAYSDNRQRDPRLQELIEVIKGQWKISLYTDPQELYRRIRDDIEAVVAERFVSAASIAAATSGDATTAITLSLSPNRTLLPRPHVAAQILAELSNQTPVQVSGPAGIGKTTLLANVAQEHKFLFVSATTLSRYDLASVLTKKLGNLSGTPQRYAVDTDTAYRLLLESWSTAPGFTLVIDGCNDMAFLMKLLNDVAISGPTKRVIYTTRTAHDVAGHARVTIPPLSKTEIATFLRNESTYVTDEELDQVVSHAAGFPLYLQYYVSLRPNTEASISAFERQYWESLAPTTREIIAYIAVANTPLSIGELIELVGGTATAQAIVTVASTAALFIAETTLGYSFRHEHPKETVLAFLAAHPQQLAYYSRRVGLLLRSRGDVLGAYQVLDRAADPSALPLRRPALFEAGRLGNVRSQLSIAEKLLPAALEQADAHDAVTLLLSIAQAQENLGRSTDARGTLNRAQEVSQQYGDASLLNMTRGAILWQEANRSLAPASLDALRALKESYVAQSDTWSAAKIAADLSALLVRTKQFAVAATEAAWARDIFQRTGDTYGVQLATMNLGSALSGIPGRETEAAQVIDAIRNARQDISQRERAWVCNLMTRRFRQSGELEKAKQTAQEAIGIAEAFGDLHLAGTNRVNLGNVYTQAKDYNAAIAEYNSAGKIGHETGDRHLEAQASRLAAGAHIKRGNLSLAVQHALHAVALLRDTAATEEHAAALEQLGECYDATNRRGDAITAYAKAAAVLRDDAAERSRLAARALGGAAELTTDEYVRTLQTIYGNPPPGPTERDALDTLFAYISVIQEDVDREHAIRIFGLHFRVMFRGIPSVIATHLFAKITDILLTEVTDRAHWRMLFPLLPLLVTPQAGSLTLQQIVAVGDRLHNASRGIHFKPHTDGAAHWVLALDIGNKLICTISSLDDRTDTTLATTLLVLFLKGFEDTIREIVPRVQQMPEELTILVVNVLEIPPDLKQYLPSDWDHPCAVTRPTRPGDAVPTIVFCAGDIAQKWQAGVGTGNALQVLLGLTLVEVLYQLLRGEVDMETLRPKILAVVSDTIS